MPSNEIEQINRIDKSANVNTESAVVTSENGKKQVVDFIDYIESSNEVAAIKIRNLRQYITDEELITIYQDKAGTITSEEEIANYLETIFFSAATYISELPNGIVIDLETGLIDEDKSFKQAVDNGIYSQDSIIPDIDIIEDIVKSLDSENEDDEKISEVIKFFSEHTELYDGLLEDHSDFLNKKVEDMNLPDELIEVVSEFKEKAINSPYKKDKHLYEISRLLVRLDDAKGKPEYNDILKEIQIFCKEHPEYEGRIKRKELPIFNADGTINENERRILDESKEAYKLTIMLKHFDKINGLSKEEFSKLDDKEKRHIILCAFAGMDYKKNLDRKGQAIAKEAINIIGKVYPNINFEKDKKALVNVLKQDLNLDINFNEISFEKICEIISSRLGEIAENDMIKNTNTKMKDDLDFSKIDFDLDSRKYHKEIMKNYFMGSKIEFNDKDMAEYKETYQTSTIHSWIEHKEDAIKLRYKALQEVLKSYKNAQQNDYIKGKIVELERTISKYEEEYKNSNINLDDNEIDLKGYKENFLTAKLTGYMTRDALEWQNGKGFYDLDDYHKKGYMRNILFCIDEMENNDGIGYMSPISKLALRRLELMNTEDKKFITFDEHGGYEINKELFLEEYRKMSPYKYSSFEELKYSATLRKNGYLLEKLEEYTNLSEEDFLAFEETDEPSTRLAKIEQRRMESNERKIHKIIQEGKIKKDKEIIENSLYEKDLHLFEICKLHRELKNLKNLENMQMYSINLSRIQEFYKKHPEYEGAKIPILNDDGTLNEDEINKMDQYSEAYQRILIVEKIDSFKDKKSTEIKDMPKDERQQALICAFAGLKFRDSKDEEIQKLFTDCLKTIKRVYPDLDLNDNKALAEFLKKEMGFNIKIDSLSLDELIEINSLQLKEVTEDYIIKCNESHMDKDFDFSSIKLDPNNRKIYSSVLKNYLINSNIKFNEKDEAEYNQIYQNSTISSWIETKEDAIKLRYFALKTIEKEYSNVKNNSYFPKRLTTIKKQILEFEKKYGKFDLKDKDSIESFEKYRREFQKAGITKHLTRDAYDWTEDINYADLDKNKKKIYIRDIVEALDENNEPTIRKLGLRRLELMNSKGKEFIRFDKSGKYYINKELLVKEFNSISDKYISSYADLISTSTIRKNDYLLNKLYEYTNLDEKDFVRLDDKKDYKKSIDQIENARNKKNQKRIHERIKVQREKAKKTKKIAGMPSRLKGKKPNKKRVAVKDSELEESSMLEFVDIDVTDSKTADKKGDALPEKENKKGNEDQVEVDTYSEVSVGELRIDDIKVAEMDESIKENTDDDEKIEKKGFMDKVKDAFNIVKGFVTKHLSKKEDVGLLGEGKPAEGKMPEGKKEKSDFEARLSEGTLSAQEQHDYSIKHQQDSSGQTKQEDEKDGIEEGGRT